MNSALEIRLTLTLLALGLATGTSFADEIASPQEGECVGPAQPVQVDVAQGSRTVFLNGTDVTASFAETGNSGAAGALSNPESTHSSKPGDHFLRLPGVPGGPHFKITGAAQLIELPGGDLQLQAELTSTSNAQRRFTAYLRLKASSPPRRPIKELHPSNYVPLGTIDPALWDFYRISPWHSYLVGRGQISGLNYRVWQDWTKPRVQRGLGANGRNLNPGIAGRLWLTRIPFWWRCWWQHRGPRRARFMADEARGSTLEATLSSLPGLVEGANTLTVQDGNTATATRTFVYDSTAPSVATTANGALDPAPFVIDFADAGCGVDLASLSVQINGVDVTPSLTAGASQATGTFSPDAGTTELTIEVTLADEVGNVTTTVSVVPILRGVSVRVLDAGVSASSGLSQVKVEVAGVSATTNFAGVAELPGVPGGSHVVTIDGRPSHVIWQLPIEVTSTSATALTVTLPRLPVGLATPLSLTSDNRVQIATRVENPSLRSAAIVVPRLTEVSGSPPPEIAIFPVDASLTPGPLPAGFTPSRLYEAYPSGLTFSPGVSLRLPNTAQLPPGTQRDLYGFKADQGGWVVLGKIQVDPSAKFLETTSPYVTSFSLFGYSDSTPITTLARLMLEDWNGDPLGSQVVHIPGQSGPMTEVSPGVYEQSITVSRGAPLRASVSVTFPGGLEVTYTTPPTLPDPTTTDLNEGSPLRASLAAKRIALTAGGHTSSALHGDSKSDQRVVGAAVGQVAAGLATDRDPVNVFFADLGLFTPFVPENKPYGEFTGLPTGSASAPNFNKALPFRIRIQDNDDDSATLAYMEFEVLAPTPSAAWATVSLASNSGDPTTSLASSACGQEYAYAWDRSSGTHLVAPTEVRLRAIVTDSTGNYHQFISDTFWIQDSPFTVTRTQPADKAIDVFTDQSILIWTSLPIDPATATEAEITITEAAGTPLPSPPRIEVSDSFIRVVPRSPLNPRSTYSLSITGLLADTGDALDEPVTLEFTTGEGPGLNDSDNDGLIDALETALGIAGGDPLDTDFDDDGVSDYEEIFVIGSDPKDPGSVSGPPLTAPADPTPEGALAGAVLTMGDVNGPTQHRASPQVASAEFFSNRRPIYVGLPVPIPLSQLDVEFEVGQGLTLTRTTTSLPGGERSIVLVGMFAQHEETLEQARAPAGKTNGNGHDSTSAYPIVQDHFFRLIPGWSFLNATRLPRMLADFNGGSVRVTANPYNMTLSDNTKTPNDLFPLGELIVHGFTINLNISGRDDIYQTGASVSIRQTLQGVTTELGKIRPYVGGIDSGGALTQFGSSVATENPGQVRPFSTQGVSANLETGEVIFDLPLFSASGPGIPVNFGLTYRSFNSLSWRTATEMSNKEELVYSPFGHGWSSPYFLRVLKENYTDEDGTPPPEPALVFQSARGRPHYFRPQGDGTYRTAASRRSEVFGVRLSELVLTQSATKFSLGSPHSPIEAEFNQDGLLVKLKRRDHGRPLQLRHPAGQIEIEDSQGRVTVLTLTADRVSRIKGPGGRVWRLSYNGSSLTKVQQVNGVSYSFGYDPQHYMLNGVKDVLGRQTTIDYAVVSQYPGVPVARITQGLAWTSFSFNSTPFGKLDILNCLGRQETLSGGTFTIGPYSSLIAASDGFLQRTQSPTGFTEPATTYRYNGSRLESIDRRDRTTIKCELQANNFGLLKSSPPRSQFSLPSAPETDYAYRNDLLNAKNVLATVTLPATSQVGPSTINFDHDDDGNVTAVEDPNGFVTTYRRSQEGNKIGLVTEVRSIAKPDPNQIHPNLLAEEARIEIEYDDLGNVVCQRSGDGIAYDVPTTQTYNQLDLPKLTATVGEATVERFYNLLGELVRMEVQNGPKTVIARDRMGYVTRVQTQGRGTVRYVRNCLGEIVEVVDPRLNTTVYARNSIGELTSVTHSSGRKVEIMGRDARGNVLELKRSAAGEVDMVTNFTYDPMDRLATRTDPVVEFRDTTYRPFSSYRYQSNGGGLLEGTSTWVEPPDVSVIPFVPQKVYEATNVYDSRDQLIKYRSNTNAYTGAQTFEQDVTIDGAGNPLLSFSAWLAGAPTTDRPKNEIVLGEIGGVKQSKNSLGEVVQEVIRTRVGGLRTIETKAPDSTATGPLVVVETRTLDDKGRLLRLKTLHGNETTFGYDSLGRLQTISEDLGSSTSPPRVQTRTYDRLSRLESVRVSASSRSNDQVETFSYTPYGEIATRTQDVNGTTSTTTYTYDNEGRLETVSNLAKATPTNVTGLITSYSYDGYGRLKLVKTPRFPTFAKRYHYDGMGRVVQIEDGGKAVDTVSYQLDLAGNVMVEENGSFCRTYFRDASHRVERVTLQSKLSPVPGLAADFGAIYDSQSHGRVTKITDREGLETHFNYVPRRELVAGIQHQEPGGPLTTTATFAHDRVGRITEWAPEIGGLKVSLGQVRDATGRLKSQVGSGLAPAANQNIEIKRDALGRRTQTFYRHLGVPSPQTVLGVTREAGYDRRGWLKSEIVREDGIPSHVELSDFDSAGNRVAHRVNGVLNTYVANAFNQITSHTKSTSNEIAASNFVTSCDSDLDANHSHPLANDGATPTTSGNGESFVSATTYSDHWLELRDASNTYNVVQVDVYLPSDQGSTQVPVTDRGYPKSLILEYDDGTGWKGVTFASATGANLPVSGPGPGLPEGSFRPLSPKVSLHFAAVSTGAIRVRQAAGQEASSPTLGRGGSLAVVEVKVFDHTDVTTGLSYDDNGNLVSVGSRAYEYDGSDRLTRVFEAGGLGIGTDLRMTYGPGGKLLMTKDWLSGEEKHRVYWNGEIYAEYDENGSLIQKYIHGPTQDAKIAQLPGGVLGSAEWTLPDPHGSVHQVVDGNRNVRNTKFNSAWGVNLALGSLPASPSPFSPLESRFGYNGRPSLGTTGLLDFRARFYDPVLGRFLNPDPSGTADGMNRYAYVHGDPMNNSDPTGLFAVLAGLGPLAGTAVSPLDYFRQLLSAYYHYNAGGGVAYGSALRKHASMGTGSWANAQARGWEHHVSGPLKRIRGTILENTPANLVAEKYFRENQTIQANLGFIEGGIVGVQDLFLNAPARVFRMGESSALGIRAIEGADPVTGGLLIGQDVAEALLLVTAPTVATAGVTGAGVTRYQLPFELARKPIGRPGSQAWSLGRRGNVEFTRPGLQWRGWKDTNPARSLENVLLESGVLRQTGKARLGIQAPPRHHVFPQEFRQFFAKRGFRDIDNFTLQLDKSVHEAIHYGGGKGRGGGWWNNRIMERIRNREASLGRMLTRQELLRVGVRMRREAGLGHVRTVPYNSPR